MKVSELPMSGVFSVKRRIRVASGMPISLAVTVISHPDTDISVTVPVTTSGFPSKAE